MKIEVSAPEVPSFAENLGVTWRLIKTAIRAASQYRFNFIVLALMGIAYQGTGFAFIAVVLSRYENISGWLFPEIAFLYGLRLMAHVVYLLPLQNLDEFDYMIRSGTFDRYLVRPHNPLIQVLASRFSVNCLGDVVTALGVLIYASNIADISWTPGHIAFAVAAVIGGGLIEGGLSLAISAFAFRFVEVWPARYLADNLLLNFGSYPLSVFGAMVQWAFTWLVPVAFIAWVPAGVILSHEGGLGVSSTLAWAAPLVGAVWFTLGYQLWKRQMRHYSSTGA